MSCRKFVLQDLCDAIYNLMLVSELEHFKGTKILHRSDCQSTISNMQFNLTVFFRVKLPLLFNLQFVC